MEVRVVERALLVLEALKEDIQGLSELSRKTNLSKATLLRILNTLIKYGYVSFNPNTKKYDLGIRILQMGSTVSERLDLKKIASPYLEHIWQISEETVYLNIKNGDERLCIDCINGKKVVRVVAYTGNNSPLYVGGSGKAILAFLDQEELDDYLRRVKLEKIAPGTITDIDILRNDLAKIRELGYATSFEERIPDCLGVSAPIFDIDGKICASISLTAPITRTEEDFALYKQLVVEASKEISKRLGYSPKKI